MKIRLISDLHIDVNKDYHVNLNHMGPNDVYTLIAGDICGTVSDTVKWLRSNVKQGGFCAGNHIVYDPDNHDFKTIEMMKDELAREFPLDSDITFFDYDVGVMQKEICDGVLLVADVMYTDYKLKIPQINENGDYRLNMRLAEPRFEGSYLNDFAYGYTSKKMYDKAEWDNGKFQYGTPKGIWKLRAKFYRDHHLKAWKEMQRIVEENPGKNIIMMTHHCLSPKCISERYVTDSLNASYVSDKERWIRKHPNIRLILSGHVHHRNNFMVGETRYVLNPLGYCRRDAFQYNPDTKKHELWTPDCFVDTETWEVTYEPYENEQWKDRIESYNKRLTGGLAFWF